MRILHLLDASAGWEQRVALSQLLSRLPRDEVFQHVATIDREVRTRIALGETDIAVAPRRAGLTATAAPAIRSLCQDKAIDLVHAWGIDAAAAARAAISASPGSALAVTVFDPGLPDRDVSVLRMIGAQKGFGIACSAERVQRRLVERGVPIEHCVVLRPAVDFAAIRDAARQPLRRKLGLPQDGLVVLVDEPARPAGGHLPAMWSALMRSYLDENIRLILPGESAFTGRLRHWAKQSQRGEHVVFTGHAFRFEELMSAADVFVVATKEDVPATAIAWAMASSTPIIAVAGYATAEFLANDLNALLFKAPDSWRRLATRLCGMYDQVPRMTRLKEVARGQAYEVFSLRRMAQQHRRFHENLLDGRAPREEITDPAMTAAK